MRAQVISVVGACGRVVRGRGLVLAPGAWLTHAARDFFDVNIPTRVSAETARPISCKFRPMGLYCEARRR